MVIATLTVGRGEPIGGLARPLDALIDALPAAVELATRDIARSAAALRAGHGRWLRLPDALVLATVDVLGADALLTTDAGWPDAGVVVHVVGTTHMR